MAGNEDTIQPEWYAPWPLLGVAFKNQLNEIRTDIAYLSPIVRAAGIDASGDFSTLDDIEQTALQAFEFGKQDFHNKYRVHYNKTENILELAYNDGTSAVPHWYPTWNINSDGHVTQQNTPTTASNLGTGQGVFFQKSGVDLEFKSFKVTTPLAISSTNDDISILGTNLVSTYSSNAPAAPSGSANVGVETILSDTGKVGNDLPFKALRAGPNVVLTNIGTAIKIESTAQVVEFYGISVAHSDSSAAYHEVHLLKVNVNDFYLTQDKTNTSNKSVILNARGEVFVSADFVEVAGDTMTGTLTMPDGTAATPAINFTSDPDTGIRLRANADLALTVAGTDRLRVQDALILASVPIEIPSGSVTSPSLAFFPDTDTGLFQNSSDDGSIAFSTNGVRAGYFGSNQHLYLDSKLEAESIESGYGVFYTSLTSDKFLARRDGSATLPAFSWAADPNTGIYRSTTDTMVLATAGVARSTLNTVSITNTLPIYAPDGAFGTPAYTFSADTDTGIYRSAADIIDIVAGGVRIATFDAIGSDGQILAHTASSTNPSYSFLGTANVGMYPDATSGDGINFATDTSVLQLRLRGDGISLFSGRLILSAGGTEGAPALNIVDGNSGLYRPATDILGVTGQLSCENGTALLPGITFLGDTTDGLFWANTNSICLTLNAVQHVQFQTTGVFNPVAIYFNYTANAASYGGTHGTVSLPAYSFNPDTNTGIYQNSSGDGSIAFSTNGVRAGFFDDSPDFYVTNQAFVKDSTYDNTWNGNFSVPTKNALYDKIETLSGDVAAVEGFYGITVKQVDQAAGNIASYKAINVVSFNTTNFYISQNSPNNDEVFVSWRGPGPGAGSGETNTTSNIGAGAGVFFQKSGVDFELKSLKSQNSTMSVTNDTNEIFFSATGTFYVPLSIEGVNPSVTIGSGASTDSITEYYDGSSLAYTMGWDDSASEFKITSGPMDNTNDEIRITPDLVTINKLAGGDLAYGTGLFYTTATADRFIANRTGVMSGAGVSEPQFCFSNAVTGTGVDSGLGYNTSGGYPYLATNGSYQQFWTTGYTGILGAIRSYSESISNPSYSWQNDANTGMFRDANIAGSIRFATDAVLAGFFDRQQNFYVPNGGIYSPYGDFTNVQVRNDLTVADEVYGAGWNGSLEVPTKNALYDKIQTIGAGSGVTFAETESGGGIWTSATQLNVDSAYFYVSASGGDAVPILSRNMAPFIHLTKTVAAQQNIGGAAGTETFISWDETKHKNSTFTHSTTSTNTRITVNETARYSITYGIFAQNGGANRTTYTSYMRLDGTTYEVRGKARSYSRGSGVLGASIGLNVSTELNLTAGQYVEVAVYLQAADGSYTTNTEDATCQFIMRKIS